MRAVKKENTTKQQRSLSLTMKQFFKKLNKKMAKDKNRKNKNNKSNNNNTQEH
jgi:hypothetical protein